MAESKHIPPGQRGDSLKRLKKLIPPQNPNIKGRNEWQIEFGDNFRVDDLLMPKNSKEKPRKLDANNIMNSIKDVFKPPEGKVTDYIKKHDPQNTSGAIKPHLDVLDKLLKSGSSQLASITDMIGAGLVSQVQQSINQQNNVNKCPPGYRWDVKLEKCVLDCPKGQHWDYALEKCVLDDPETYRPNIGENNVPTIFLVMV